jgi:hypothetical protein
MKRRWIVCFSVAWTLVIVLELLIVLPSGKSRPFPRAGATSEEFNGFAHAQQAAAGRSRLPPFREVSYRMTPLDATVTTQWYLRRGHPFLTRSVRFPYHMEFQRIGPREFKFGKGPHYFTGTSSVRWKWKWDI